MLRMSYVCFLYYNCFGDFGFIRCVRYCLFRFFVITDGRFFFGGVSSLIYHMFGDGMYFRVVFLGLGEVFALFFRFICRRLSVSVTEVA